ncbi:MAG: ribosome rescue protein RqcH [Thermoprotei archaeon]
MKSSLNALDVLALSMELRKVLQNSYVDNIYHFNDVVIFRFRQSSGEKNDLRVDVGKWIRITSYSFEPPREISNWCKMIRNKLVGLKLQSISQPSFDRLLEIEFDNGCKLYLEGMDNGNIILTEPDNTIAVVYKTKETRERILKRGVSYTLPVQKWFDPLKVSADQILEVFKSSKGNVVQSIVKFLGLSGEIAEELVFRSNLVKDFPANKLELDHVTKILSTFRELYDCSKNVKYPVSVWSDKKPVSVSPCMFEIYKYYKIISHPTFNNAVDEYAHALIAIESEVEYARKIEKEKSRLLTTISEQEKMAKLYFDLARNLRSLAVLIQSRMTDLGSYLDSIRKLGWEENLRSKLEELFSGFKVLGYDKKSKSLVIVVDDLKINIRVDWSVGKNIEMIFNLAKEYERKFKRTLESIEKLKIEMNKINEQFLLQPSLMMIKKPSSAWYESFHYFRSSDGFLVVGGKDASQNESLIKRRMESNDIVVHADIHGSPFVLIKGMRENISQKTIEEAGQFVVSFSRAWSLKLSSADAYWVYPEQVSKKAPSGTYLRPGSFMIYGQRNYIRNIPLKLAVTLFFDEGWAKFYVSPIDPVKMFTDMFVEITPGGISREDAAKQIIKFFYEIKRNGLKMAPNRKNLISELIARLPRGEFSLSFHS